jgi:hypothetical protein
MLNAFHKAAKVQDVLFYTSGHTQPQIGLHGQLIGIGEVHLLSAP